MMITSWILTRNCKDKNARDVNSFGKHVRHNLKIRFMWGNSFISIGFIYIAQTEINLSVFGNHPIGLNFKDIFFLIILLGILVTDR